MASPLIAAIFASILHVISGPDHLAAVTPMVIETDKKAWKIGFSWGLGHILGMLLIGVLFVLFNTLIPVEAISQYSEQLVAFILIGVGLWAFYRIFNEPLAQNIPHFHNEDEPIIHIHKHKHGNSGNQHSHAKIIKQNLISSFGIGFVHGLAGIAHFLLLLPALSFETQIEGLQYLSGFAIGTIIAMSSYALILSQIAKSVKYEYSQLFFNGIRFAGGLFAIIIGLYWLYLSF